MGYYLGVLGTARISKIALATEDGEIIKMISAPPLTIRVDPNIRENLERSFLKLAGDMGISFEDIVSNMKGACVAMSGVITNLERTMLEQILDQIGFYGDFPRILCQDVNAHLAANFIDVGGVVIGGTGAAVNIKGIAPNMIVRVDGWGSDIGDDGGGYDLGRKCLRELFKSHDLRRKRIPKLEKNVLSYVGLTKVEDLVQWFYNVRATVYWRTSIADLTNPLIQTALEETDRKNSFSNKLLRNGAKDLFSSLKTAVKRISNDDQFVLPRPCDLILEGGIFENCKIYTDYFSQKVHTLDSEKIQFCIKKAMYNPVVGALALAISNSEFVDKDNKLLDNLKASAEQKKLKY